MEKRINELIGYEPGWIIRNGNLLFILFFMLLFAACYFIRYPQIITVPVTLAVVRQPQPASDIEVTAAGYLADKIRIQDTIILKWKEQLLTDSSQLKGTVIHTFVSDTGRQNNLVIRLRPFDYSDSSKVVSAYLESVPAVATITLAEQKISDLLWQGIKNMFTINSSK